MSDWYGLKQWRLAVILKRVKLLILMLLMTVFHSGWVIAQESSSTSPSTAKSEKDKRKTSIDFEDELVEGEVKKPELFYLLQKKQFNFKRLIKLREDFLPEMKRQAEDVNRVGSRR